MDIRLLFGISVALGLVAWGVACALYIWPTLRVRSRADALRPLLMVHAFRFDTGYEEGQPDVAPDLPAAFARWARRVIAVSFVEGALVIGALAFVPSTLHERFQLPLAEAGAVVALFGLGGLLYSRVAGRLLRKLGAPLPSGEHGRSCCFPVQWPPRFRP